MITWTTPAGSLGLFAERITVEIPLQATTTLPRTVSYSVLAGALPRGLRLTGGLIKGSPTEVKVYTTSRFVIRATDGVDIEDRTFTLAVDGSDQPIWLTREGFLNVGPAKAYFVLDNSQVNFQLEATDPDLIAGGVLQYYLMPNGGVLPPGLTLSRSGLISGFTDPVFAVAYTLETGGGYDTTPLDVFPIDFVEARSNGFDTFVYDAVTFDYNEPSRLPRRLSRIYNFVVAVTDGVYTETRLFKIYVVTEEFLQSDNSIVQVDTNIFQADSNNARVPIWITNSDLGRVRANNYVTIFLDVYDPPSLTGTITYFLLPVNPDGSVSQLPPGMTLDTATGDIAGNVPYQARVSRTYTFSLRAVNYPAQLAYSSFIFQGSWNNSTAYKINDAVDFQGVTYLCQQAHVNRLPTDEEFWRAGTSKAEKTFSLVVVGEIESAVAWVTDSDLGTLKPNTPSEKFIQAESFLYGARIAYELVSGSLPPGLTFLPTGIIQGKVKQFADDAGPGLTRFFERTDSLALIEDISALSRDFSSGYDTGSTTFDQKFLFVIRARDSVNFAAENRTFSLTVQVENNKTFANLYVKAFQSKTKRLSWYNFITDAAIFPARDLYRYGDVNFGVQPALKVLIFAGVESVAAVKYVQAMSRNHYTKRLKFGQVKSAQAKDPQTQQTIYEIVYVDVVDDLEKNGRSISSTVNLADNINSPVLISVDNIKIDSDIPLVSDRDHRRVFLNSIKNMRARIAAVGDRDRGFLPLWMRSIQDAASNETGYVKALPLCYCQPGSSARVMARIRASGFDFKSIDFVADRYVIDALDNELEDKYLAFPKRNILNKFAKPSKDIVTLAPVVFASFDSVTATFDNAVLTFDQG